MPVAPTRPWRGPRSVNNLPDEDWGFHERLPHDEDQRITIYYNLTDAAEVVLEVWSKRATTAVSLTAEQRDELVRLLLGIDTAPYSEGPTYSEGDNL